MSDVQELKQQHSVFMDEAFAFLLYSYEVEKECPRNFEIFRPIIGEAILVISNIFRKVYLKTFCRLHENLKHIKMFERYCKVVPVNRESKYFLYYYLTRVSIIFELAMYCYKEDFNYFKAGRKCVVEDEDIICFESAGNWSSLEYTADLIASLGRPLTLIVDKKFRYPDERTSTFEEAVQAVWKRFTVDGNLKMLDSAEMTCLMKLKEKFKVHSKASPNKNRKVKGKKRTSSLSNRKTSPGNAAVDTSLLDHDLEIKSVIMTYFKKSVASFTPPDKIALVEVLTQDSEGNKPSISNLNTSEKCDMKSSQSTGSQPNPVSIESDSLAERKDYEVENKTSTPSKEVGEPSVLQKKTSVLEMYESSSNSPIPLTTSNVTKRLLSPSKYNVSPKRSVPVLTRDFEETEYARKGLSETTKVKSEDCDQNVDCEREINPISQEDYSFKPSFIIPEKYLRDSAGSSRYKHLFSAKMCPPSPRRKLDEQLKKIMDENINNLNYNIMPSGDIFVYPPDSPSVSEDTLIIFAESSSDEEGDDDIDKLTCLFKKIEIETQGSESGYLLRPRQVKGRGEKLKDGFSGAESATREISACDKGTPSKFSRRVKITKGDTSGIETRHAEELIKLYRKYFGIALDTYFSLALDKYFKRDLFSQLPAAQYGECSESIPDISDYVFAVSASIMAKRKVLLDKLDNKKPVLGVRMYSGDFIPVKFPLCVQRALDSQIEKQNYFAVTKAVYGVGSRRPISREDIWAVLLSAEISPCKVNFDAVQAQELARTFSSYRPVLKVFCNLEDSEFNIKMDSLERILFNQVKDGFHSDEYFNFLCFNNYCAFKESSSEAFDSEAQ